MIKVLAKENVDVILDNPEEYLDPDMDLALFEVWEHGERFLVMAGIDEENGSPYICLEDDEASEDFYPEEGETLRNTCTRAVIEWTMDSKEDFLDILVGDYVIVYDEYCHDYVEHLIQISEIECDDEYITDTNPSGKVCYGDDLDYEEDSDYCVTHVNEANFVRFASEKEIAEHQETMEKLGTY